MEIITAEQAIEMGKGLTFEKVWSALMENRIQLNITEELVKKTSEQIKETSELMKETAKRIKETDEQMKETDKRMKETDERIKKTDEQLNKSEIKTEKILANLSKNLGGLGNSLGLLTETLFSTDVWKKFNELGYTFSKQGPHLKFIEGNKVIAEADYFLENGEYAMPVEVKTVLDSEHIAEHLERINIIRRYMDARNDSRKLIGAVAGGSIPENAFKFAQRKGLFVIVLSGENVRIADVPKEYAIREWPLGCV